MKFFFFFKYLINTFIAIPVNYHTVFSPQKKSFFDNEIAADATCAAALAATSWPKQEKTR